MTQFSRDGSGSHGGPGGTGGHGGGPADAHMLAGAYALDALDPMETEQFERHALECRECADEVRGLRETAAVLGMAVATTPPPALRAKVLEAIARTPQLPPAPLTPAQTRPETELETEPKPETEKPPVRLPGPRRPLAAVNRAVALAAALAVLLAGGLGAVGWQRARDAELARQELARAMAIASSPDATRQTAPVSGGGSVTLLMTDDGAAVVTDDLADPGEGRIYQLWINHPGEEDMRSAGLGPAGQASGTDWARVVQGMRPGDAFALSIEPEGGSAEPTTDPVVLVQT